MKVIKIIRYAGQIKLIPIQPMKKLRGFLKGIDTDVPRDKDSLEQLKINHRS